MMLHCLFISSNHGKGMQKATAPTRFALQRVVGFSGQLDNLQTERFLGEAPNCKGSKATKRGMRY